MIEIKSIRFIRYDKESHRVFLLLLTEENEALQADILLGLPEIMSRETIEYINSINMAVSKNFSDDEKIDVQKVDIDKLNYFFIQILDMITLGRLKGALEVPISQEVD